ncbi:hypothetical protein PV325_004546 [Microctonus aethiopoides]|nr:hypothetical protein PV325_004546 [Microctonus aethiopoides]
MSRTITIQANSYELSADPNIRKSRANQRGKTNRNRQWMPILSKFDGCRKLLGIRWIYKLNFLQKSQHFALNTVEKFLSSSKFVSTAVLSTDFVSTFSTRIRVEAEKLFWIK